MTVGSSGGVPARAGEDFPRDVRRPHDVRADPPRSRPVSCASAFLAVFALLALPGVVSAEPATSLPAVSAAPPAAPAYSLEALSEIPSDSTRQSEAQLTDDSIAAAVERGTNPDLEHRSGFRKRSQDLFRTEREIEIGNQEMLVRLRLRAKSRETVSVELRF
jgi:hypothetical protein